MERKEEIKKRKSTKYRRDYRNLPEDVKARYEEKIQLCGGIDPYSIKQKDFSLLSKDFPAITVLDIANYMISSTSPYTQFSFNAYKSTEAYTYFESGFVQSLGAKNQNDLSIMRGRVNHSQKMNEGAEDAWVLAHMNGRINCAHCTCTGGLSETCSHVGAICFAVASMRECAEIKSVTDELCKWNIPRFKDVSMSEAVGISWNSTDRKTITTETNFRLHCDSLTHFSDEAIIQFIEKCNSDGDTTTLETILFPEKKNRKTNIRDELFLASLYDESNRNKSHTDLVEIGRSISLNITNDEVKEISKSTLPDLKAKCGLGLRRGRITGSQFKNCCTASIDNPSITTIRQLINPINLVNVPSIKYQSKNKKKALDQYKSIGPTEHVDFEYNKCGVIINPRIPYFAGSNDGIISCTCHGNGCLEIKCLKILESNPSFELLTRKPNNILNKEGNLYVLEKSHEVFYQVQLQINLINLNFCDLVIWSPKEFLLITVQPDVNFWEVSMKKALAFHEKVIMPELLGKFYTKNTSSETNTEEKEQLVALEIEILRSDEENRIFDFDKEDILVEELGANREDDDLPTYNFPSSSQHKSEREHLRIKKSKKKNTDHQLSGNINGRNLMKYSIEEIVETFYECEDNLKLLYAEHIQQLKRHYRPKNIPDMIALDIVNEKQFEAMVNFAEKKLVHDREKEHNYSDVIFDAIIPEWALSAFCKKFSFTRSEALETLYLQSQALINKSDSEM